MANRKSVFSPTSELESVRVTLFIPRPSLANLDVSAVWAGMFGVPPNEVNEKPSEGLSRAVGSPVGSEANVEIVKNMNQQRLDVNVSANMETIVENNFFPAMKDSKKIFEVIREKTCNWITICENQISRLAIGLVILRKRASTKATLAEIKRLAKSDLDLEGAKEFSFSVNKLRKSLIEDVSFNCIESIKNISISGVKVDANTNDVMEKVSADAVRLERDFNTTPESTDILIATSKQPILDEIYTLISKA